MNEGFSLAAQILHSAALVQDDKRGAEIQHSPHQILLRYGVTVMPAVVGDGFAVDDRLDVALRQGPPVDADIVDRPIPEFRRIVHLPADVGTVQHQVPGLGAEATCWPLAYSRAVAPS